MTSKDRVLDTANGLRALADLMERKPDMDWPLYEGTLGVTFHVYAETEEATRERMVALRRQLGGNFNKEKTDYFFTLEKWLSERGEVKIAIAGEREAVCERVVVGTETKTERVVPDDRADEAKRLREQLAALEVEQQVEVEKTEWQCPPSLTALTTTTSEGSH